MASVIHVQDWTTPLHRWAAQHPSTWGCDSEKVRRVALGLEQGLRAAIDPVDPASPQEVLGAVLLFVAGMAHSWRGGPIPLCILRDRLSDLYEDPMEGP